MTAPTMFWVYLIIHYLISIDLRFLKDSSPLFLIFLIEDMTSNQMQ
jgi:hypothetical protein